MMEYLEILFKMTVAALPVTTVIPGFRQSLFCLWFQGRFHLVMDKLITVWVEQNSEVSCKQNLSSKAFNILSFHYIAAGLVLMS